MTYGLTSRQLDCLMFIQGWQEAMGFTPRVQDIADGIGCPSKGNAHWLIVQLEQRGFIRRGYYDPVERYRKIHIHKPVPIPRGLAGEPLFYLDAPHLPSQQD